MEKQIDAVEDKASGIKAVLRINGSTTATLNVADEVTIRQLRKRPGRSVADDALGFLAGEGVEIEEVLVKMSATDLVQTARAVAAVVGQVDYAREQR